MPSLPLFTEDQATAYFIHKRDPETLHCLTLAGVTHGKKACDVEKVIFGPENRKNKKNKQKHDPKYDPRSAKMQGKRSLEPRKSKPCQKSYDH